MPTRKLIFLLILVAVLLLLAAVTRADITNATCQSTAISRLNNTYQLSVNNGGTTNVTNITLSGDIICPFGCNGLTGFCNQSDPGSSAQTTVIGSTLGALGLFALGILWKPARPWEIIFRILFIFFGLFLLVSSVAISNGVFSQSLTVPAAITNLATTNLINIVYLQYLVIAFTIVFFFIEVIFWLKDVAEDYGKNKRGRSFEMLRGGRKSEET